MFDLKNNLRWKDKGVIFKDINSVTIGNNVKLSNGVILYPGVVLEDDVTIKKNVVVQNATLIKNNVTIGENSFIGPFNLIRNNTVIGNNSLVGSHCEITRSTIANDVKIYHRSFIGDTTIEQKVQIGCNVTTANSNFENYFETIIKTNTKIGVGVILIAPIVIGSNCLIGAGATITKDIKNNSKIIPNTKNNLIKI